MVMGYAGNEVVKESFMDMKVDELILQVMREKSNCKVQSLYDGIRVPLTPGDNLSGGFSSVSYMLV